MGKLTGLVIKFSELAEEMTEVVEAMDNRISRHFKVLHMSEEQVEKLLEENKQVKKLTEEVAKLRTLNYGLERKLREARQRQVLEKAVDENWMKGRKVE